MAMLRPMCFCAVKDRRYVRPDLCREGVGGIVAITPIYVEVWTLSRWNDYGHIGSERGSLAVVHCAWSCTSHRWE
jgi:hypothetical protein